MATGGSGDSSLPESYFGNVRREIESLLPESTRRVLEFGCAFGGTVRWLRSIRDVERAVGIELMEEAASRAREVFDDVLVTDLARGEPDLSGECFDLVLALDVLEHLPDPHAALRLARRHMAPGATLIVSLPNVAHHSIAVPLLLRGAWEYTDQGLLDRTHLRFFTRRSAINMIVEAGFEVRRLEATRLAPRFFQALGLKGRRWRWYDERLMRAVLPARLVDFQHLIAAVKPV